MESFFRAVPSDSGCCFVVVQHLSPEFKSILEELLARQTALPIHRIEPGMAAAPNAIFLIPPKKLLTIRGGRFQLSERDIATVAELPINAFFESLAAESGARAVGVVLSGGGSDGSAGVRAIHEAGGLVIVQRPDTAEFESMPRHALAATPVDHTLAPEDMPAVIVAYARNPTARGSRHPFASMPDEAAVEGEPLDRIMALLRQASGIDFGEYKIGTVERRIERRMTLQKLPDLAAYAALLATNPDELNALYGDMLIGVTEFFRDNAAFEALREKVAPGLLSSDRQNEVRVWIAACATGEEAYSLAILLDEVAVATGFTGNFSIFATDVHRASLEFAATGTYGQDRLKNVSPERLARYFREEKPGCFRIVPEIRKRLIFAPHNLVSDPPFTKLDLVSCRNLLIYFNTALQERVIRLFYFALRGGGCLFLGPSEGIGRLDGVHFEVVDAQLKFFRKLGGAVAAPPKFRPQQNLRPATSPAHPAAHARPGDMLNRQLLVAYDQILRRHAPAGLLVNDAFEVLHYFGPASSYLAPLEGRAHESLLSRVDGELRLCLSTLLPRVFKTGESSVSHNVRIPGPDGELRIDIRADPIVDGRAPVSLVHVTFADPRQSPLPIAAAASENESFVAGEELLRRVQDLELELQGTKENLQTAVEELQASNEELQSSNEELTASNEELQSTNEELHAVNEELYSVNSEFERKNTELQILNDDLNNLSNSTDIGTVFVDRELRIRKFNPAIQRIFRLLPQDLGRPIDHIAYHLDGQEEMLQDVAWVLEHGKLRQKEVRTHDGRWLLKRVLPFLTVKGAIDGVVLTFTDIDETKALQTRLDLAMESSHLVWWEWDLVSGRLVVHCGQTCILGYTPATLPTTAAGWEEAVHPDDLPRVRAALEKCLIGGDQDWSCEHRFRTAENNWLWVLNSGKVTERGADRRPLRMLGTTQNISARHAAEEQVHRDAEVLSKIQEAIICTDAEGVITYWNEGATKLFGWTAAEMVGRSHTERFPASAGAEVRIKAQQRLGSVIAYGEMRRETEDYRKDGSRVWTEARLVRINDSRGSPAGLIAVCHDITARRQAEQERRQLEQQLLQAQKMDTMGTLAGGIAHDFNNIIAAILGYTELALAQNTQDERSRRMHEGVLKAAYRARDLVKRILTFSRFHEAERRPIQLAEAIAEAAKFIRASLPATIELELDLISNCPRTLADSNQLHQVLLNLSTNAAHAMRERGGRLTLRLRQVEFAEPPPLARGALPAGSFLALEVADTGHGIDPETLKKIFDPFFTTKPAGEGTGLGLSIVHGIISGHGGGLDVRSTLGVGTTFTLYLPIVTIETGGAAPGAGVGLPIPRGNGQRIAVIDDEEEVGRVTQANLQHLGYDVTYFQLAEDFFADFSTMLLRFELIVTDQTMPRLTGLELSLKLRVAGHHIPIVVVSGYSRELTDDALAAIGHIEYLRKPYKMEDLAVLVHRLLQQPAPPSLLGAVPPK